MVFLALKTFDLVFKDGDTDFGTRSKVLKTLFCIIKTFDLLIKVVSSYLGTRSKVYKWIDLVPVAYF